MEQSVTRGDGYGTEAPPVAGGGPEAEGGGSQGPRKLERCRRHVRVLEIFERLSISRFA